MLRIRLDINGREIGCIGVHNTQKFNSDGEIKYNVYDIRDGSEGEHITEYPHLGSLWHDRTAGASSLSTAVFEKFVDESVLD